MTSETANSPANCADAELKVVGGEPGSALCRVQHLRVWVALACLPVDHGRYLYLCDSTQGRPLADIVSKDWARFRMRLCPIHFYVQATQ